MLLIFPIALYLIGSTSSILLHLWKPKFRFSWLISILAALAVVGVTLLWRLQLPLLSELTSWNLPGFEPLAISLLVDETSWGFALSIAVLVLTALIADTLYSDPLKSQARDWLDWPVAIGLAGLAFIPLLSENTFTLLVGWALLDIVEFGIRLRSSRDSADYRRAQYFISTRLASLVLVISAIVFLRAELANGAIEAGSSSANLLLLAAAAIRLWSIPGCIPKHPATAFQRPLDVLLVLAASSSSLMLVARLASTGYSNDYIVWLYFLLCFSGIAFGLAWLVRHAHSSDSHFLLCGLTCLAMAAMIGSNASAAFTWGISALLISGLAFLFITRLRWSYLVMFLGWIGITGLPLTPAWAGGGVYSTRLSGAAALIIILSLLILQAFLLAGVIISFRNPRPYAVVQERWAGIVYSIVLLLIPGTQWLIFIVNFASILETRTWPELLLRSWPAFVATGLSFLVLLVYRQVGKYEIQTIPILQNLFSFRLLNSIFERIYQAIKGFINFLDAISDGQGGILWTILFVLLLFALLIQLQGGS